MCIFSGYLLRDYSASTGCVHIRPCKSRAVSFVCLYVEGKFLMNSFSQVFLIISSQLPFMTLSTSTLRLALAGATLGSLILSSTPLHAQSTLTHYSDVQAGAWYESAADELLRIGALEPSEPLLRPNDMALRSEMVKLLVRVNDKDLVYPNTQSFDDVPKLSWPFPYFETAARAGWVRGDADCYGTRPCYAGPYRNLNRAEAAALLVRAFSLGSTGAAPTFSDNANRSIWYYQSIQTAADHCILQGDDLTGRVRPASNMNRAEMVVMFDRAYKNLKYGTDCSSAQSDITLDSAVALNARKVRLIFSSDLNASIATDAFRYRVATIGGQNVSISSATLVGSRTVDLVLSEDLTGTATYRVTATNLRSLLGIDFNATRTFTVQTFGTVIISATPLAANRVRVVFNADIDSSTANDAFRYSVRESSNNNVSIGIQSATIVDGRTVDLNLSSNVKAGVVYRVNANSLMTTAGATFNAESTFNYAEGTPSVSSVTSVSSTALRVTFATNIDRTTAETSSNFRVTSNGRDIPITNVRYIDARTVEITLGETQSNQRSYVVTVTGLKSAGGTSFSDSGSTIYVTGNVMLRATLIGAREVPPVLSAMSGSGTFTLSSTGVQYDIVISGVGSSTGSTITGAHFHRGAAGVNGPVIVPITVTGTHFTGTWTNLSDQDRNDLLNGNVYVNVHTQAHPDGEIRGQVIVQ